MPMITDRSTKKPLLDIGRIGHGTLESLDLQKTRCFYEEVLGFEVIQTSPRSLLIRKGVDHTYAVVESRKSEKEEMPLLSHNGLDVGSKEEVDRAHAALLAVSDRYGVRRITKPMDQHGDYAFYFMDLDGNWWEIVAVDRATGGYAAGFSDPAFDLTGRHDLDTERKGHVHDEQARSRFATKSE